MKITIYGMGYVGCVTAACLAKEGHAITGLDLDENKVNTINSGASPITEPGLEELIRAACAAGGFRAATEAEDLGDLSIVCVGTPSNENGSLDLGQVQRVCEGIGRSLGRRASYHLVNIRSTVTPGTVEGLLIPILEKHSGRKAGVDFGVCMNPEFLRESTAIADFYKPPFTVIGALDKRSADMAALLYAGIPAPVEIVPIKVAEMIKYSCNCFHGLKVAFANEVGSLCKVLGIDSWQVMDIFCRDTKLNLSPYYLRPGFAFGGSCLPKDLRAIVHLARQKDVEVPVLASVLASNELQIERAYRLIKRTGRIRVGVLGLSFKAGSDDLRESPTVALIERLIGKGYQVSVFDDDVSLPDITGKNKQFIERTLPHISSLMKPSLKEVIAGCEVLAVCKKREDFALALTGTKEDHVVVDLVRLVGQGRPTPSAYHGICW
jgi:GDP-mannose 6-dehydrogenase